MSIAHSTGRARSGDVSIFYRKLGNRGQTPILIVHGLSYFSWDWLEVGRVLAADREVVAIDMRGFGDSDWSPQKDYSVPSMAQDIVNVLDHPGWTRALLVGHSMGGRGTTYVAARHAQRVAGLALIERARSCRVEVIGPVPLGGRFWSAYLVDPFGIRLEFATDRSGGEHGVVESVLQTEEEARAELQTLFSDPKEVQKWLRHMPLKKEIKMGPAPIFS